MESVSMSRIMFGADGVRRTLTSTLFCLCGFNAIVQDVMEVEVVSLDGGKLSLWITLLPLSTGAMSYGCCSFNGFRFRFVAGSFVGCLLQRVFAACFRCRCR